MNNISRHTVNIQDSEASKNKQLTLFEDASLFPFDSDRNSTMTDQLMSALSKCAQPSSKEPLIHVVKQYAITWEGDYNTQVVEEFLKQVCLLSPEKSLRLATSWGKKNDQYKKVRDKRRAAWNNKSLLHPVYHYYMKKKYPYAKHY